MKYRSGIFGSVALVAGLCLAGCSGCKNADNEELIGRRIEGTVYKMETGPSRIYAINLRRVIQNYTGEKKIDMIEDLDRGVLNFPNLGAASLNEVLMNVDENADSTITAGEIASALKRYKEPKTKVPVI